MRVKVGIIGGGPSGLLLSQLLDLKGISNVVLERRTRDYVLGRIRAGVLEHGFCELMREAKCGERMDAEGELHDGFFIADQGAMRRVDLKGLTGEQVMVYGQTELTRDLYEAREAMLGNVIHKAEDVTPHDMTGAPYITYTVGGRPRGWIVISSSGLMVSTVFHGVRSLKLWSMNGFTRLAGSGC